MMKLRHKEKAWSVYLYWPAKPTLGDTIYQGRYKWLAYAIGLAVWPFTTRTVSVTKSY